MGLDPFFSSKVRLKHSLWEVRRQTPPGGRKVVEALYAGEEFKSRKKKQKRRRKRGFKEWFDSLPKRKKGSLK
jgi:hypothetical protein